MSGTRPFSNHCHTWLRHWSPKSVSFSLVLRTTRPATNKRQIKETQSTETTNNENRYDYAGHLARSPPPHSSRQHRPKRNLHRRPTSCHSTATTPPPTSAELTTRQHSSNKTTPLRPDSSSSSHHSDSKTAVQTTTMIPTLSSSMN